MDCLLCVKNIMSDETGHLCNDCEVSKHWWHKLDFLRPMKKCGQLTRFFELKRLDQSSSENVLGSKQLWVEGSAPVSYGFKWTGV